MVYNEQMSDKNSMQQNILAASLALFSAKGYEGTSLNELASAARITKPTLYYYFGSKEGLFDAVCQENYAQLNSMVNESAAYSTDQGSCHENTLNALTNLSLSYFSFAIENEMFYRLTLANLICHPRHQYSMWYKNIILHNMKLLAKCLQA